MEEGTHDHLLTIPDGVYAGLVHAQQLEHDSAPKTEVGDDVTVLAELGRRDTVNSMKKETIENFDTWKKRGFFRSFGLFLYEQRTHSVLYFLIIVSAMGAGCESKNMWQTGVLNKVH